MSRPEIRQVLIVDDNRDDRAAVVRALRADTSYRYAFHEAASGREALRMFSVASDVFDLVILDYRLNDMNAAEIVAEITKGHEIPSVPIILLTGSIGGEGRSQLLSLGVQDYFSKSAVTAELLPRIADNAIERHRLMWQLYESEQSAASAKEEAERANRVKSQFLTSISHELRTPLTAILGFTELVRRDPTGADADGMLAMMATSGTHLAELLDDLIDIAKIEAEKLELFPGPCRLRDLVTSACELMGLRASERGLALECLIDPDVPEVITIDSVRLRQIVINLLSNAVKFTDVGKISCRVSRSESGLVHLRVTDTGRGIAPAAMERIFNPFEQGAESPERRSTGIGLGLAISKRLATMMGGDLRIEATSSAGTTFILALAVSVANGGMPVARVQEGRRLGDALHRLRTKDLWSAKRVLLAEDLPANQFLIRKILEPTGLQLECVDDGEQAVKAAVMRLAEGRPFDLILMDMQMPVMNGFDAVRQLGRLGHQTPIVAVTAGAVSEERNRCLEAGCRDIVTKPLDLDVLRFVMEKYLG